VEKRRADLDRTERRVHARYRDQRSSRYASTLPILWPDRPDRDPLRPGPHGRLLGPVNALAEYRGKPSGVSRVPATDTGAAARLGPGLSRPIEGWLLQSRRRASGSKATRRRGVGREAIQVGASHRISAFDAERGVSTGGWLAPSLCWRGQQAGHGRTSWAAVTPGPCDNPG
jgi:hypothetical protein